MRSFYQSLLALWGHLGANQRVSLAISAMIVVAGLAALVSWSRRPDYQLLYGRLGEKDASAVISQLQAGGIPHRFEGGAVYVPAEQVHRLRMDLAGKGIPSGEGIGFEIFDKGNFGVSDFVQRTNYARALQGELSRTISQLEGVRSARVLIVQPENRLLMVDQTIKPSASVFIELGGGRISPDQVNAIRHLVSNSVQGLLPDAVAVVDNRGRVLSEELKNDPLLATASSQIRYRQSVEDYFSKKVESMLSAAVGAGNAIVRVSAEVDTDATTIAEEKFDPEGQVVRTQTNTEDNSTSAEARAGGAVGTAANVPADAAASAAAGAAATPGTRSEQIRKNRTTSYEINSTRTSITRTPGAIRSITAAVFLNQRMGGDVANPTPQPRTPAELTTLRQLVVNALGVKLAPGLTAENVVALQEVAFPAEPLLAQAEELRQQNKWQPYADTALRFLPLLAAAALVLFFIRRLGREKPEAVPIELLRELPSADGHRALGGSPGSITPELINELIRQKPTNVGTALRDWMAINKQT